MNYWWVNQKKTYIQEVAGGYMQSPQTERNGRESTSYNNMKKVKSGDVVFSYCNKQILALGVVTKPAVSMPIPIEDAARNNHDGWYVEVEYFELNNKIWPKNNMSDLIEYLPKKYSPLLANGNGNQKLYLTEVQPSLADTLIMLIGDEAKNIVRNQVGQLVDDIEDQRLEDEIKQNTLIGPTERARLIRARRGQGTFRINVERIEKHCRVTKTTAKELLIASHIKPWRYSDDIEKIDGNNGLLLAPHIDKLFDAGYISFEQDDAMLISPLLDRNILRQWGVDENLNVGHFSDKQESYLIFHREVNKFS
ncbi:MAG TPA: HNH endonuclease [Burkholderiales bacterium]|nr:HNH endonuclease [Burkholderiales bacterium]